MSVNVKEKKKQLLNFVFILYFKNKINHIRQYNLKYDLTQTFSNILCITKFKWQKFSIEKVAKVFIFIISNKKNNIICMTTQEENYILLTFKLINHKIQFYFYIEYFQIFLSVLFIFCKLVLLTTKEPHEIFQ